MPTVAEIMASIERLSVRERCELNVLLRGWDKDDWDKQMAMDAAPGGKLDRLRIEAEINFAYEAAMIS